MQFNIDINKIAKDIIKNFKNKFINKKEFILIDVLCDSYVFINKENIWLDAASKISKRCLSWSWANDLIPMAPNIKFNNIKGQVDFFNLIRKLPKIIGNSKLRNHSFKIMETILNIQNREEDFCTLIYENSKNKNIGGNNIDQKYNVSSS